MILTTVLISLIFGLVAVAFATFTLAMLGYPPLVYAGKFPRWLLWTFVSGAILALVTASALFGLKMPKSGKKAVSAAIVLAALSLGAWAGTAAAIKLQGVIALYLMGKND